jgi:hypothetical protein
LLNLRKTLYTNIKEVDGDSGFDLEDSVGGGGDDDKKKA